MTKTVVGRANVSGGKVRLTQVRTYPSARYTSLSRVLQQHAGETGGHQDIAGGCFAVAGPGDDQHRGTTNLSWNGVHVADVSAQLSSCPVRLANDLEAGAAGIVAVPRDKMRTLQRGATGAQGNRAIIAAGTGLGEAGMYWDAKAGVHRAMSGEGGHTDFAATNEREIQLVKFLASKYGHVSNERVASGMALPDLYEFALRETGQDPPRWLHKAENAGQRISDLAKQGDFAANAALDLMIRTYGKEAGNLALKIGAWGGVYVAGGIAPKHLQRMIGSGEAKDGPFLSGFNDKGRMVELTRKIPVKVVLDERVQLRGAALLAEELVNEKR